MVTKHPEGVIPLTFYSEIHISFKEAEFMKADLEGMKSYREAHSMMGSDDLAEATGDKRARALSTSSVSGSRKSSRYE